MSVANNFGADEAAVLLRYTTGDYAPDPADFGGSPVIADALEDAEAMVIQAMGADLWRKITDPDLELVESRGTDGQTTVQCGLTPIITNMVYVWRGMPSTFQRDQPAKQTDRSVEYPPQYGALASAVTNYGPAYNLAESAYSAASNGAITLVTPLQREEQVFVSYRVNTKDSGFSLPSVANVVANGAAYAIGSRVYPREDSSWALVEQLKAEFDSMLTALNEGKWTPSELRLLRWWKPVEKAQDNIAGSVRRWRA